MTPRRGLGTAVVACLAGAGLALFAATRVWADGRDARTGADLVQWLPAVALVALAGAGALLALRGAVRRAAGVLIAAAGLAASAGAVLGLGDADGPVWPVLTAVGGLAAAAGGLLAVAKGGAWPALGARYERTGRAQARVDPTRDAWDALDRGDDPTAT